MNPLRRNQQAPVMHYWEEPSLIDYSHETTITHLSTIDTISLPIFNAIEAGEKTVDVRLNFMSDHIYLEERVGTGLVCFSNKKTHKGCLCKATSLRSYRTIQEMFAFENWRKIFPFFNNEAQALINQSTFFDQATIKEGYIQRERPILAIEFTFIRRVNVHFTEDRGITHR